MKKIMTKNGMSRKAPAGWKIGDKHMTASINKFGSINPNFPTHDFKNLEAGLVGVINYFQVCNSNEAKIKIGNVFMKVRDDLVQPIYAYFEKGNCVNIIAETIDDELEVVCIIECNKIWNTYKKQEKAVIKEGIIEDILDGKGGSIMIELEETTFEIKPKHYQRVLQYISSETVVELELDMEQKKVLSVEAKDPTARVSKLQEYLFMKWLDDENPTRESLMLYDTYSEITYGTLLKGITPNKMVA